MSRKPSVVALKRDNMSHNRDGQAEFDASAFAGRLNEAIQAVGITDRELSRRCGVPNSTIGRYKTGENAPKSQHLFQIADALGVSARFLLYGQTSRPSGVLALADEADWVSVPEYDLRALTPAGKGEPLGSTTFRRDWLNRTLLTDSGLWTTRLLSAYPPAGLVEGDVVIARDMALSELAEGHLCFWGMELMGELSNRLVGRYSMRAFNKGLVEDGDGGYLVDPALVGPDEHGNIGPDRYFLIGRILGRPLAAIR